MIARMAKWSEEVIETKNSAPNLDRLEILVLLFLDVLELKRKIPSIFDNIVELAPVDMTPKLSLIERCFDDSGKMLTECLKRIEQQWSNEIISQTSGWAKQVADIPRLYRKTNREAPTKPCNYVEQILKPIESFWTKNSGRIESQIISECLIQSCSHLNQQ